MKAEHAEEYTQALGQVVAGGWRQIALGERLGVPKALGLSTREWVEQRLGGYVKLSIEERHGAVKELRADKSALSNRRIAAIVGVNEKTIRNDAEKSAESKPVDAVAALAAENAKDKQAARRERETALRKRIAEQEAQAREAGLHHELVHSDIAAWRPTGVSAVITDPPYIGDALPLYRQLRDFALDVLPSGGSLVVMTWQAILPDVITALSDDGLAYRWTICWRYANTENTVDHARRVFDCWKPVLVYHRGAAPADAPMFRDEIASLGPDKAHHEWGQQVDGFRRLVRSFSHPGDTVCDPFVGGGTTAKASLVEARNFIGCDVDAEAVAMTERRLAE